MGRGISLMGRGISLVGGGISLVGGVSNPDSSVGGNSDSRLLILKILSPDKGDSGG